MADAGTAFQAPAFLQVAPPSPDAAVCGLSAHVCAAARAVAAGLTLM